ncbi:3,4-dihydroxy-2-butanone 4-phosphate synthase [Suillus fuscotomentosus]|uniref:3,4-dihydroxy-2-butanone 4-phosphate synthase n=1 Tax=Suillus fuscotomentosus TaxID=1912939 RepID=A0AAD4HK62_9AGAM|nr:3,4-dihydroxy-2-butanone 4-phosphate synthase [Suillus fuscotomentosus]KAG1899517.1 3,4-dihydroxy-2-butanone 4-phosphate synthase [Suillus fuscotomentosus]
MPATTVQDSVPEHHRLAKTNGANNGSISPAWIPTQVEDITLRTTEFSFDTVEDALHAFARGEAIVVMDDERRENEGDLIISASHCSVEAMAWMIKHTSGYICISLPEERLNELEIPMMVPENQERHKTAYTITVDYKHGTTTGISAHDRSLTVRKLVDPTSTASDFSRPGHMVPLRAQNGGVLERRGHTETGVDLCTLTNQPLGGVLCELVNDDALGTMARRDDCRSFANRWGLKMISVDMLAQYRKATESRSTVTS